MRASNIYQTSMKDTKKCYRNQDIRLLLLNFYYVFKEFKI